jgi:hypothetical protein
VHKGFACPPGHSAAYIDLTDREFGRPSLPGADRGAYLRKIKQVKLLRLRKLYAGDPRMPEHQRHFPFRSVRMVTRQTPPIEPVAFGSFAVEEAFVPYKNGVPFLFHLVVTDWAGQEQDFLTPLVWVSDTIAYQRVHMKQLVAEYLNDGDVPGLRTRPMRAQRIAVRQQVAKPGDTTVQLHQLEWGLQNSIVPGHPGQDPTEAELSAIGQPDFYPSVQRFTVDLPEVQALAGSGALQPTFAYDATYLSSGSNPTQVFLARAGTGVPLRFNTGSAGGVITPNVGSIEGISATYGPVSGPLAAARAGTFAPASVFLGEAKLLGGLTLAEILGPAGPAQAFKITSKQLTNPNRIEATLDWHPVLAAGPPGVNLFEPLAGAALDINAQIVNRLDKPEKSTVSIAGQLRRFRLHLFGKDTDTTFVILTVEQVRFTAGTNQKSDVHCELAGVEFVNALHFVAQLAELCSFTGGSGLKITVDEGGIAIGLTVNVPSISVGVFSLRNLAIGAGLDVPFNGDPVLVDFTFGSPDKPFILSVYGFGGGGFVVVSIGADRMHRLEIDLQFGAFIDFDVGVASGGIELAGGFNFKVETTEVDGETQQNLALTLYVRLYGEVDVLGIVSVSLELYLGLTYQSNPEMLFGEAEMTLTIEVGPFDKDVSFTCRKEFAGNGAGAPGLAFKVETTEVDGETSLGFGDTMSFADWAEYCTRFAPVGV